MQTNIVRLSKSWNGQQTLVNLIDMKRMESLKEQFNELKMAHHYSSFKVVSAINGGDKRVARDGGSGEVYWYTHFLKFSDCSLIVPSASCLQDVKYVNA